MAAWAKANLLPDSTPLGPAVRLAHRMHHSGSRPVGLAWIIEDGLRWHNGATGSFQSAMAIAPNIAIAALSAFGPLGGDHDLTGSVLRAARQRTS